MNIRCMYRTIHAAVSIVAGGEVSTEQQVLLLYRCTHCRHCWFELWSEWSEGCGCCDVRIVWALLRESRRSDIFRRVLRKISFFAHITNISKSHKTPNLQFPIWNSLLSWFQGYLIQYYHKMGGVDWCMVTAPVWFCLYKNTMLQHYH